MNCVDSDFCYSNTLIRFFLEGDFKISIDF